MDIITHRLRSWWLPLALGAAITLLATGVVFSANATGRIFAPEAGWTFSGNVYEGLPQDISSPLPNVTVTLYGSESAGVWGTLLASVTTNAGGAYALNTTRSFPYYHLVETDRAGFYSTGSQPGPGGTGVNFNWIRFQAPPAVTLAGNHFWDRQPVTPTPTTTPQTPTPTPTYKPYPTYTPTATTTGTVPNLADVKVSKRMVAPTTLTILPGTVVEYELLVTNAGPAAAADVVATDTLPAGFTFESASSSCTQITSAPPNDIVRCQIGALAAGQTINLTVRATVQQSTCGRAKNRVEVTSTTPDTATYNNNYYASVIVSPCTVPGLLVNKRQLDPPGYTVRLGEIVTYAIDITNIGSTPLSPVSLVESVETEALTYVDASPLPSRIATLTDGFELSWRDLTEPAPTGFGRVLPPGGSLTVIVRARAIKAEYAYDCANVMAKSGELTVSDYSCTSTSIDPGRDFVLYKELTVPPGGTAYVGQGLTFMVWVENSGSIPITGIRLRDEYNTSYLTFGHAAYTPDSAANDGVLDWANLTQTQPKGFGQPLSPGSSRGFSVNFSAKAVTPAGQPTENCVQAWYWHEDQMEHDAGRYCLPVRIISRSEPQIEVSKIVLEPSGDMVVPGNRVKFAFRVTNTGTTTIKNIKVTDTYNTNCLGFLPSGDAALDPNNTADDGTLDWASWQGVLALAPGAWLQIAPTVQFQTKAGPDCASTANDLQMTATDTGGKQVTATGSALIHIVTEPQAMPDVGDAPTKFNHAGWK